MKFNIPSNITMGRITPNPFEEYLIDANKYYSIDGRLLMFHTTTAENAKSIIENGLESNQTPPVGFDGRIMPKGVWFQAVPFIPWSIDNFLPKFNEESSMEVLVYSIDSSVISEPIMEQTWYAFQWCLEPKELTFEGVMNTEDILKLRDEKFRGYVKDHVAHDTLPKQTEFFKKMLKDHK